MQFKSCHGKSSRLVTLELIINVAIMLLSYSRLGLCANKTPWYMIPFISILTTNELSMSERPSSAKQNISILITEI